MPLSYLWQSEEQLDAVLLDELTLVSLRHPEMTDWRTELVFQWLKRRIDNPNFTKRWFKDQCDSHVYLPCLDDGEFSLLLDTLWDTVEELQIDLGRVPWAYTLFEQLCADFSNDHWFLLCEADIEDAVETHEMSAAPVVVSEWINNLQNALQVEVVRLQLQFSDLVGEVNDCLSDLEEEEEDEFFYQYWFTMS